MKHSILKFVVGAAMASAGLVACGQPSDTANTLDAARAGIDSAGAGIDGRLAALPTWKLKDVQPLSPKNGQTYGLETFSNKIVVVTLLEGF
jgi:hypothetical protein